MTDPTPGHDCDLCHRHTQPNAGHGLPPVGRLCGRCAQRFRDDIDTIVRAWRWLTEHPGVKTGTNAIGGADPQLPGGTGRLSFLASGEGSPHGTMRNIAVAQRAWLTQREPDYDAQWTTRLDLVADIIRTDVERGGFHCPDIADWCVRLAQHSSEATALCGWGEPGQWVTCPTDTDGRLCGRRLRIDLAKPHAPVVCRWCDRVWTALQLLNLAMHSGDGWADPASAAEASGVTERQIMQWVRSGAVEQRNSLVSLGDVRAAKEQAVFAGTRRFAKAIGAGTVDPSTRCPTCGEWAQVEADTPGMVDVLLREWRAMHATRHSNPLTLDNGKVHDV